MIELSGSSFIAGLTIKELQMLRRVLKQVHWVKGGWRRKKVLSDYEADRQIEAMGPRIMMHRLKTAIDNKSYWGTV